MNDSIEQRIRNVMSAVFQISADETNEDSSSDTITSWDSLKHFNMIMALEEEFDIEFGSEEIVDLLDFKRIKLIVLKKQGIRK
jgi:acyl carrier protein